MSKLTVRLALAICGGLELPEHNGIDIYMRINVDTLMKFELT